MYTVNLLGFVAGCETMSIEGIDTEHAADVLAHKYACMGFIASVESTEQE